VQIVEILQELEAAGKLFQLVKSGKINPNTRLYLHIFEFHKKEAARRHFGKGRAVSKTMEKFNVSQRTVYNALKFCRE
jgi:hypothetical protein